MLRRYVLTAAILLTGVSATACATAQFSHQGKIPAVQENTVTLINPFIVPEDRLDETLAMWEQARDFLQEQPGYISTALHQSLAPDAKYRLINVAVWQDSTSFMAATKKMQAESNLPRIDGVVPSPALYTVVRTD